MDQTWTMPTIAEMTAVQQRLRKCGITCHIYRNKRGQMGGVAFLPDAPTGVELFDTPGCWGVLTAYNLSLQYLSTTKEA